MTNGEKLEEIFPNLEYEVIDNTVLTNIDNGVWFSLDWWNTEYKEPSNSEKPNKSVEEKCPCYDCEHFEIKGWSHCKIHEDAYGNSRCNDYHKVNQGSNKSENPIGSTTNKCTTCEFREIDGKPHEMCKSCVCGDRYKQEPRKGYLSIDDVMEVFDDFMCGEVDEDGIDTFVEMLRDKADMREVEE